MKRTSETRYNTNGKRKRRKSKERKTEFNMDRARREWNSEELDLNREIYALSHYVNNRESLIDQVFLTIRGEELQGRIPDGLKSYSVEELKNMCLEELQYISEEDIICILSGKYVKKEGNMRASLESQQTDSTHRTETVTLSAIDDQSKSTKSGSSVQSVGELTAETLDLHADQDEINSLIKGGMSKSKHSVKREARNDANGKSSQMEGRGEALGSSSSKENESNQDSSDFLQATLSSALMDSHQCDAYSAESVSSEDGKKDWLSVFTKTQMEILELELRAKAIRSLMHAQNTLLSDDEEDSRPNDSLKE